MKKVFSTLRLVFGLIVFGLLLAPVVGLPLWVEVGNQSAAGEVVGKREEIDVRRATWSRQLFLDVRYTPADSGLAEQATIAVDPELYDRMRVGAPTTVHYLPRADLRWLGALAGARLEGQPPYGQLRAMVGPDGVAWVAGIGVWLALLAIWWRWRSGWLALILLLGLLGAAMYTVSDWPAPAPPGPQLQAQATVRDTHLIDRLSFGRRRRSSLNNEATQPYRVVELQFTPEGRADPVVAVDLVDEGSVPGLENGGTLPIRYSVANPRWAQIEGAQRTYAWKNLTGYAVAALVILVVIVAAWAFTRLRRRRRATGGLP